jgi:class 3 adenylate cyclase
MDNESHAQHQTILFADISGSTSLYERLGDTMAQQLIGLRLDKITAVVTAHGGRVVKCIGDELMCAFPAPGDAVRAARAIHDMLEQQTDPGGLRLAVRIGLHHGRVLAKDNDLFGDAVNVAARVTALAKAQQTLTTAQTVETLTPEEATMTRCLDQTPVKGKTEMLKLHEVIWRPDNLTVLHGTRTQSISGLSNKLVLIYQNVTHVLQVGDPVAFTLGRDTACRLPIASTLASRQHGKIEHRHGKFVLVDHSANGTYVSLPDIQNLFLHREELPLFGNGVISCGEKIRDNGPHLIHFSCE